MIQNITKGLRTASTISCEMLKDKEVQKCIIQFSARTAGFASAGATFINMPETTSLLQKAIMSFGVGLGTTAVAAGTMIAPPVIAYVGLRSTKSLAPETYSKLNEKFNSRVSGVIMAATITAGVLGGYNGHHVLTDKANDLMEQSHISAREISTPRP